MVLTILVQSLQDRIKAKRLREQRINDSLMEQIRRLQEQSEHTREGLAELRGLVAVFVPGGVQHHEQT